MPRQQAEMTASRTSQFQGILAAARNAVKPNDSVRALLETLDQFTSLQAEPMGFQDQTDAYTTIVFTDATKTFTIAPVGVNPFDVWVQGKRYRFTSPQSIDISLSILEGLWFFYYDNTGTLQASQTPWDLSQHAPIALIYWDATGVLSSIFADERHGLVMDWVTHKYNHLTSKTRFESGLPLTGNTTGDGSADSHSQVDISPGNLWDEDILIDITDGVSGSGRFVQDITPIAQLPIFYLDGATPDWRKVAAGDYSIYNASFGIERCRYNLFSGGNWSAAQATANGRYIAMWIFGSNDKYEPVFAIMGQREDITLAQAQANNNLASLSFPSLPLAEMRVLYRLIFQTSTVYTAPSGINSRLRDIEDYRQVAAIGGSYIPTDHNSIPGRAEYPAHPGAALNLGTRTQVLYVAQSYGSDGGGVYNGTDPEHAFATLTAARTAAVALAPATDSAGVAIVVLDGMEYDEDFAHVDNVWVIAPYATIKGKHTMAFTGAENFYLRARRLINDGENDIIAATGTAGRAFIQAEHIEMGTTVSTTLGCINQASTATLDVVAKRIYSTSARAITSTAAGLISVSAQEIEGGAHAYNLAATSVVALLCSHIVGPVAVTAGAKVEFHTAVTLNEPAGDNSAGTQAIFDSAVVGESVAFPDLLYQKSDGKWWKSDADAAASTPGLRMALESKIADETCSMLVKGRVQDNDWNWTVGSVLYAGLTPGSISDGVPSSGSTIYKQVVGVAYHADKMLFDPSPIVVPRTALYDDVVVQLTEPLTDDSAGPSRIQELVTVGEAVAFPDLLYLALDGGVGKWKKADADAAATMPGLRMALETKAADGVCQVLRMGRVQDNDWNWTIGGLIYASTTAGELTQTAPSGTTDIVQVVGIAYHADKMLFDPSPVTAEVV